MAEIFMQEEKLQYILSQLWVKGLMKFKVLHTDFPFTLTWYIHCGYAAN